MRGKQYRLVTVQEEEDAEVTALAGEADMPLEQLLAMYGMVIDEDQAGTQVKAEGIVGEASDPSRPRKRRRLAPGEICNSCSA